MSDLARPSVSIARRAIALSAIACMTASAAHANIVISTTRAIVPEPPGHTSIRLSNTSPSPSLVQIWADSGEGDSTPDTSDAPFEMTPTLFVLNAHETQVVRIDYEGVMSRASRDPAAASAPDVADHAPHRGARPPDEAHETLYWLNVLDVPSDAQAEDSRRDQHAAANDTATDTEGIDTGLDGRSDGDADADATGAVSAQPGSSSRGDDSVSANDTPSADPNALRFVIRTRIKLIVRPKGLAGSALDAPSRLAWHHSAPGTSLTGFNASPYYVTCAPLFVIAADRHERALGTHTFAPRASQNIALDPDPRIPDAMHAADSHPRSPWTEVVCHAINDYGSIDVFRAPLNAASPTSP